MIVQTKAEMIEWLQRFPDHEPYAPDNRFRFRSPEAKAFWMSFPKEPGRLVVLARMLTTAHVEEDQWDGAYLWFTEWDIWREQEIGYRLVERIRLGFGDARPFETATVHRYRADERQDAAGALLLGMLFGWDTCYMPLLEGTVDFVAFVSHDEVVEVTCRTREAYDQAFDLFSELKFEPKPVPSASE